MNGIFEAILSMSVAASIVIVFILLLRLVFRKAPKVYSYVLWSVALLRLLCPWFPQSPVSILPQTGGTDPAETAIVTRMDYYSSITGSVRRDIDSLANGRLEEFFDSHRSAAKNDSSNETPVPRSGWKTFMKIFGYVWVTGFVLFLGRTLWQYLQLRRALATSFKIRENVYESECIRTAFIMGLFRPKIYLPLGLTKDMQEPVIRHERTHQRRRDQLILLASYIAMALHWFNPLVRAAFRLACLDMESSCDETVICDLSRSGQSMRSVKLSYSYMLYALGSDQRNLYMPVSFAETGVKQRIKNVLGYKGVSRGVTIAVSILAAVGILICSFNPTARVDRTERVPLDGADYPVGTLSLDLGGAGDVSLEALRYMPELRSLSLAGSQADDLGALAELPELEYLDLSGCELDSGDIDVLADCTRGGHIGTLVLRGCTVPDASSLEKLDLSNITKLDLRGVRTAEPDAVCLTAADLGALSDGLAELGVSVPLRGGTVSGSDIDAVNRFGAGSVLLSVLPADADSASPADYAPVSGITNLRGLEVSCGFADPAVLGGLSSLRSLSLSGGAACAECTAEAARLSGLEELTLDTDGDLGDCGCLAGLENLRSLHIRGGVADCGFVGGLGSLEELVLRCPDGAALDLGQLASGAPALRQLVTENVELTGGERLAALSSLRALSAYYLDGKPHTVDFGALGSLDGLELLELWGVDMTSADLRGLSGLDSLRVLHIAYNGGKADGADAAMLLFDLRNPHCDAVCAPLEDDGEAVAAAPAAATGTTTTTATETTTSETTTTTATTASTTTTTSTAAKTTATTKTTTAATTTAAPEEDPLPPGVWGTPEKMTADVYAYAQSNGLTIRHSLPGEDPMYTISNSTDDLLDYRQTILNEVYYYAHQEDYFGPGEYVPITYFEIVFSADGTRYTSYFG